MQAEANVSMGRVMADVTMVVRITGRRGFAVRQWIAIQLVRLAALTLGCGIEVDLAQSR